MLYSNTRNSNIGATQTIISLRVYDITVTRTRSTYFQSLLFVLHPHSLSHYYLSSAALVLFASILVLLFLCCLFFFLFFCCFILLLVSSFLYFFFFFFNDTATTEIYTLSLHDALPI